MPQVETCWGPLTTSMHEVLKFGGDVIRLKPSFGFRPSGVSPSAQAAAALSAGSAPWFSPRLSNTSWGERVPCAPPSCPTRTSWRQVRADFSCPSLCSALVPQAGVRFWFSVGAVQRAVPSLAFHPASAHARRKHRKGKRHLYSPRLLKTVTTFPCGYDTQGFLRHGSL